MEMQESGGLFDFTNDYYKNGNVKSQEILGSYKENFDNTTDLNLTYTYDKSNRLLETENANQQYKDHFKLENAYDKDGNILELKRYDGDGSIADNFNYAYYSNTNKLQRVTGSVAQYTYDANGNMLTDDINRNKDIKYDYRNLIIQLRHKKIVLEDSLVYLTYYYYDEAGNRIRKRVYQYIGVQTADSVESPDEEDIGDAPGTWELIRDELYSRGADGKELAIYVNSNIKQTNIWGFGHEGYITTSDAPNFYLKDHLGSIRIVTNENDEVISAQDYDAWGYLMEGRTYESDESVYKFTGKVRDEESEYDYSYARNYNSRVGIFNSSEPVPSSSFGWGSFVYCADNPLRIIDPSGEEWYYMYDDERSGSWQFFKDEPWKEIWGGQYDESGNKIMELKQGYKELLFFQGSELQWLMESGEILRWAAVSGILDEFGRTQPHLQGEESKGPIPEGWWIVDPHNAFSFEKNAKGIYDIISWKLQKGARGMEFINIYPTSDNPSERKSGFSIHGGEDKGSIGCIDLTSGMQGFFDSFISYNKSMLLNVKY